MELRDVIEAINLPELTGEDRYTQTVLFDVDGVLADVEHRLHWIENKPKKWMKFFADAVNDEPHPIGCGLAHHFRSIGYQVHYLTGRPEDVCREQTESFVHEHAGLGDVNMRPKGDGRPANVTKLEVLETLGGPDKVALCVDDDPRVAEAYEQAGYRVHVATWMPHKETLRRAQEEDGRT